jgi:hypothetical protein
MDECGRVPVFGGPPILAFTSKGFLYLLTELEEKRLQWLDQVKNVHNKDTDLGI